MSSLARAFLALEPFLIAFRRTHVHRFASHTRAQEGASAAHENINSYLTLTLRRARVQLTSSILLAIKLHLNCLSVLHTRAQEGASA
ncbi:hypothetical protein NDU88_000819 [Pleurodeles waltl]|uniref:Uncharacterized protein n=1 Tax=Pleurodeles waltl TaxID=8319 RepID=A0AAV7N909_PLEWA|nr:hypothetical protein NDU88_000818 [Pleurodeles waltl]KAJ1112557.1 hypothetical protein NDU88_000819 [Pleurodeles waltl]